MACTLLMTACGWLHRMGHQHTETPEGGPENAAPHAHEAHGHDEHDHRMYGGWDTLQYPTAANLYRAMNLIAETRDPSDSGRPSHSDMFVATFSEAYVRYKPDSEAMQQLKQYKSNAAVIRFSGANWDDATQAMLPRLVRVLDLLRTDSVQLQYRSRGLNGAWHYRPDLDAVAWPIDSVFPSVEVLNKGGGSRSFAGDRLLRPEWYLLESWRP